MSWLRLPILFIPFFIGCSGMVAPTNESAPLTDDAPVQDGEILPAQTEEKSEDAVVKDDPPAADKTEAKGMGEITDADGDLAFEPKSAYAMIMDNGQGKTFMLSIMEMGMSEDAMTKKVKDYTCTKCGEGECETTETEPAGSLSLMIMDAQDYSDPANPAELDNVDDNGMPLNTEYTKAASTDLSINLGYSGTDGTKVGGSASADDKTVTFTTAPKAVGDEFEVVIDGVFIDVTSTDFAAGGKTWKGTIKTKVIEQVKQPTPPDCEDDEYAMPNYEE